MTISALNFAQTLTGVNHLVNSQPGAIRYLSGTRVFNMGDTGDFAYMIDKGYIEISSISDGKKNVLAILGPGEVFGEMAMLDGLPRSATATAMHDTTVVPISSEQLRDELDSGSPLVQLIMVSAISRMRTVQNREFRDTANTAVAQQSSTSNNEKINLARVHATRQLKLRFDMEKAIATKQFELAYQPIVSLADGRTAGFEVLLRWPRSDGSITSPDQFIPLAEQSGLIVPIGAWVLKTALQSLAVIKRISRTRRSMKCDVFISVNVSPKQLEREEDIEHLAALIEQSAVDPTYVKIEITEAALLLDPRMATIALARLKATGASIAIDDFGTGYSSLNYLHRFPLDVLKIDRSFISRIVEDKNRQRVVTAIIGLAHELGMDVVAEGVEEIDEAQWLMSQGCQYVQGYLMAKPAPFAKAIQSLKHAFEF